MPRLNPVDVKTFKEYLEISADIAYQLGRDDDGNKLRKMAGLPTERVRPLYEAIAWRLEASRSAEESGNDEWGNKDIYEDIKELVDKYLPSGAGIDSGVNFNYRSIPNHLHFQVPYHHMNEYGMYVGWITYDVFVTASLAHNFDIEVSVSRFEETDIEELEEEGIDVEGTIDYLADVMHEALSQRIED